MAEYDIGDITDDQIEQLIVDHRAYRKVVERIARFTDETETPEDDLAGAVRLCRRVVEAAPDSTDLDAEVQERAKRRRATIIAALRYWQVQGLMSENNDCHAIATANNTLSPLNVSEIEVLCGQL